MTRLSLKLSGPAKRAPELPRNHDDMNGLLMTGLTDPGRLREQNEDSIACVPQAGLAVVADGMGGHKAGEVASKLAVDVITRHIIGTLSGAGTIGNGAFEGKMIG